jgi:hypothetical protein
MREDPDQRCGFHSKRNSFAAQRASDFTRAEAIQTVGKEIRVLRRAKGVNPVERADALRNLILLWQSLATPEVEPPPKPLTLAEKLKKLEDERKEN